MASHWATHPLRRAQSAEPLRAKRRVVPRPSRSRAGYHRRANKRRSTRGNHRGRRVHGRCDFSPRSTRDGSGVLWGCSLTKNATLVCLHELHGPFPGQMIPPSRRRLAQLRWLVFLAPAKSVTEGPKVAQMASRNPASDLGGTPGTCAPGRYSEDRHGVPTGEPAAFIGAPDRMTGVRDGRTRTLSPTS